MRRFDKKNNIRKANLLAEQRYLESKGLINESLDDAEDSLSDEDKSEQERLTQKYKKTILNAVPNFNDLVERAVDGFGDKIKVKVYSDSSDSYEVYPIEVNGDILTIRTEAFKDDYDLNNYASYGDPNSSWDSELFYWFKRLFSLLKKSVKNLDDGKNYYNFYIVDTKDNNRILDTGDTREWTQSELNSSYYDSPGAIVVSKNQLIKMGGTPIVVGG
jgi:hypothetical protein